MAVLYVVYGRFLTSNARTMPTTTIATIMPMIPGTRYRSATDCWGGCVGTGVGAAGSTLKAVTACDGQYDLLPANEA